MIYRSAARLSRRELADLTGVSHSVIWYWEVGRRQGIYDIRQLLHFADAVQMPREALLPVILGQPCGLDSGHAKIPVDGHDGPVRRTADLPLSGHGRYVSVRRLGSLRELARWL